MTFYIYANFNLLQQLNELYTWWSLLICCRQRTILWIFHKHSYILFQCWLEILSYFDKCYFIYYLSSFTIFKWMDEESIKIQHLSKQEHYYEIKYMYESINFVNCYALAPLHKNQNIISIDQLFMSLCNKCKRLKIRYVSYNQ